MKPRHEAYNAIEDTMAEAVRAAVRPRCEALVSGVRAALEHGDFTQAHRLVNDFTLRPAIEAGRPKFTELGVSALLFGASRHKPVKDTSHAKALKISPYVARAVNQLTVSLEHGATIRARAAALMLIADAEDEVKKHPVTLGKADVSNEPRDADGKWTAGGAQTSTKAFKSWFGDSKVVDDAGQPVVVYHGTNADVVSFNTEGGKGKTFGTGAFFSSHPDVASSYASSGNGGNVLPVYLRLSNPMVVYAKGENWNQLGAKIKVSLPAVTVSGQEDENLLADLEGRSPKTGVTVSHKAATTTIGKLFPGELKYDDDYASTDDLARVARARGYDGMIVHEVRDRGPSSTNDKRTPSMVYVVFGPTQVKSATGNKGTFDSASTDITKTHTSALRKDLTIDELGDKLSAAVLDGVAFHASAGANLITSRLASYGFLSEAAQDNVTTYMVSEVLDDKTCPVCLEMDGTVFDVAASLNRLEIALNTDDPADLKEVAPWPDQSEAGVKELAGSTPAQLQAMGFDAPPFHPFCRGILVTVNDEQLAQDDALTPEQEIDALIAEAAQADALEAEAVETEVAAVKPLSEAALAAAARAELVGTVAELAMIEDRLLTLAEYETLTVTQQEAAIEEGIAPEGVKA